MNLPAIPTHPHAQVPGPLGAVPGLPPVPPPLLNVTPEQKLELLEYWRSIKKRRWAILALVLAVAALAAVFSLSLTPIFSSSATVLIEAGKAKIVSVEEVYSISQQREHYQTQVEIMKSREVALRAAKATKLWEHPDFDPRTAKPTWRQRALAAVGAGDKLDATPDWTEEKLAAHAAKAIQQDLTVTPVRMSQLVRVSFEAADKELAAKVANAVAQQYLDGDREDRFRMTTEVSQQLQERLTVIRQKLADSERALQQYREQKGLVATGGSTGAQAAQQLGGMTERLMTARARRIELEGSYQQARSASPATLGSLPAVARDPGVLEAQRLFDVATGKLSELQARLGPAHDQVQQAQADLAAARTSLQRRQQLAAASLTKEYEAALATERALMQGLGEARGAAQGVNREEFQLAVLEREYQSNKQLYDMFMSRAKETSLIGDVQPSVGRVTEAAVPAEVPHKPNRRSIVTNAALVALLLGMLAAVAIDRLDNTVKGSEDAELRLRSPVLASLPQLEKTSRRDMAKLFLENKHSHFAEGIRTARTGIALSSLDEANKRLLVTSSIPGEGKTTVSVNLAFAHAHANQKTLLIDCDMRRAHTSRLLGLGSAKFGVSHLVAGTVTAAECIVPMGNTGLYVLPVGEAPPNPLEVLLSKRFKETLEALSKDYPMIVIDSPPVELVSDALVIAPLVSNVAVVVRAMSTPAPLVRKTQQRLARAGGRLLGVVINGLNFQEARQYYGEYAHSSYSYGYDAGGDTVLDDPSASTKKKRSRFIGSDGGKKPGDKTLEASGDDRKAA